MYDDERQRVRKGRNSISTPAACNGQQNTGCTVSLTEGKLSCGEQLVHCVRQARWVLCLHLRAGCRDRITCRLRIRLLLCVLRRRPAGPGSPSPAPLSVQQGSQVQCGGVHVQLLMTARASLDHPLMQTSRAPVSGLAVALQCCLQTLLVLKG